MARIMEAAMLIGLPKEIKNNEFRVGLFRHLSLNW